MTDLLISLEPDELQGLHAITALEAAANGGEADPAATARSLMRTAIEARLADLALRWNPSPEAVSSRAARLGKWRSTVAALATVGRARKYLISGLAVAILIVLWGGYGAGWRWTGFQANHQLWDWLRLLLLPVVVGTIPLWIQHPEYLSRTRRLLHLAAAAGFVVFAVAGYLVPLRWTGFPGNTLWDWLGLVLLPAAVTSARFLPSLARSLRPHHQAVIAAIAVAWAISIVGGYAWHWTWTGYQGNTLWDWLGLLLLPLLVPMVMLPAVLRWVRANTPAPNAAAGRVQPNRASRK